LWLGRHLARQANINQINPANVANGATINVPVLERLSGSKCASLGAPGDATCNPTTGAVVSGQQLCDALGNCNVQTINIYGEVPSLFFVPYVGWAGLNEKQNTAVSSYSALQASLRHTFTHGLTLQAAYTWEHAIDDSTSTYLETSGSLDD